MCDRTGKSHERNSVRTAVLPAKNITVCWNVYYCLSQPLVYNMEVSTQIFSLLLKLFI